jgi:hypothetical protein
MKKALSLYSNVTFSVSKFRKFTHRATPDVKKARDRYMFQGQKLKVATWLPDWKASFFFLLKR